MTCRPVAVVAALLLAIPAAAESPERAARKAFYDLVDRYQMFVVPHCDPATVTAYRDERAARDTAFVQSLQGTKLAGVYARAVSDREKHDRRTVYECGGPSPPPAPPAARNDRPPTAAKRRRAERAQARRIAEQAQRGRVEHFAEADRLFAEMVALRDRVAATSRN